MKNTAHAFFKTASLFAILGMCLGLYMAISADFTIAPAHGHFMLFGFVAFSIFGTYYKLWPTAGASKLAQTHLWLSIVAVIVFVPGIALANLGKTEALAKVGSLLALASMALFFWTVLRNGDAD